jgi:glycerol-3-phosphate O-acyltransferase
MLIEETIRKIARRVAVHVLRYLLYEDNPMLKELTQLRQEVAATRKAVDDAVARLANQPAADPPIDVSDISTELQAIRDEAATIAPEPPPTVA